MSAANFWNNILRQHADATVRVSELVTPTPYRGWKISRGRWPEAEWMALHPDYDASWEGEEDGWVDNGLKADAATYEALCAEIDAIEEERGQARCTIPPEGWWCSREAGHEEPCAARPVEAQDSRP